MMSIISKRVFCYGLHQLRIILNSTHQKQYAKDTAIMAKMLAATKRKSRRPYLMEDIDATLPKPDTLSKGPAGNRRVAVLNKLFMKHITDLMATGKNSEKLSGLGIEVTKIKVGREYNVVNVYWTSLGKHTDSEILDILRQTAGELRQELTGLHVIGKVPKIQFVRDRTVGSWASVEAILSSIDFGPDYIPTGLATLKSEFNKQSRQMDDPPVCNDDLPPMRQNVFGLDRKLILGNLSSSMKGRPKLEIPTTSGSSPSYTPFDQKEFSQFLLKRRILKEKILREAEREPVLRDEEYDVEYDDLHEEEEDYIEDDKDNER